MTEAEERTWRTRLERERRARQEAESLLEGKSRELFDADAELRALARSLEQRVEDRTHELTLALEAAQAADRAKSDFRAVMSHEVRTPMNGILGFTRLLLDGPLEAQEREFAETILRSAEAPLVLINDLLDLSKIEAGRLTLEDIAYDVGQAVRDVAESSSTSAQALGLTLTTCIPGDLPTTILGDSHRVRQILLNLVGNAVEFTETGGVTIQLSLGRSASDSPSSWAARSVSRAARDRVPRFGSLCRCGRRQRSRLCQARTHPGRKRLRPSCPSASTTGGSSLPKTIRSINNSSFGSCNAWAAR